MRRRPSAPALALALVLALGCSWPLAAQVSGEDTVSGGTLQSGGPDVTHGEEASGDGLWFSGNLSDFQPSRTFGLQWEGVGTPDFRLRGTLFQPGWLLEATVNQRAYFVGGDARFAWDPGTGVLDTRVPESIGHYLPLAGSNAGQFDPGTLTAARALLPESSPGWAMRDFALTFRTLGQDRGIEISAISTERDGVVPRTLVTATGFAPAPSPLTVNLPVGAPFGVVEVPDRFFERSVGLSARAFATSGAWRWEGSALVERYQFHRLVTDWANPFPGPPLHEPGYYRGTQGMVRMGGRSPNASVSVEFSDRWGHGEGGERHLSDTRLRGEYHDKLGTGSWFVQGLAARRRDDVALEPAGLHPVFQGPYYDLLGKRYAPAIPHTYPTDEAWGEGGIRSPRGEISARFSHFHSPNTYARDRDTLSLLLAATPLRGLRLEVRPSRTWASDLNPGADRLSGGWVQARGFLPVTARDWKGLDATARYMRGPFMLRGTYSLMDSPDAPGLRRRESDELFAGMNLPAGAWVLRGSARLTHSDLSGTFTTYALPGDPVDPEDPSHRLPMGERWRRGGGSLQADLERAIDDVGTVGLLGRWDHQDLRTDRVIDQPRRYQYGKAGLFWSKGTGAWSLRAEAGVESYENNDVLFLPADPPPGPYLWAGLTERPGTRAYVQVDLTFKF